MTYLKNQNSKLKPVKVIHLAFAKKQLSLLYRRYFLFGNTPSLTPSFDMPNKK
jgi:hypothetical protein